MTESTHADTAYGLTTSETAREINIRRALDEARELNVRYECRYGDDPEEVVTALGIQDTDENTADAVRRLLKVTALERAALDAVCAEEVAAREFRSWKIAHPRSLLGAEASRLLVACGAATAKRWHAVDALIAAREEAQR